jgi:hypothetical protein
MSSDKRRKSSTLGHSNERRESFLELHNTGTQQAPPKADGILYSGMNNIFNFFTGANIVEDTSKAT